MVAALVTKVTKKAALKLPVIFLQMLNRILFFRRAGIKAHQRIQRAKANYTGK